MWIFIAILILALLLGIVGICWYFAGRIVHRTSGSTAFTIDIVGIDPQAKTITLKKTKNTRRPGIFGVRGANGQAIVGPIILLENETVTRQLRQQTGTLSPQEKVAWNTTVYGGLLRDHLNLTINEVAIPGPLGEMPAWFVPGKDNTTWAILVHGATGTQEQGLRAFPILADLGIAVLDISYRNDRGAPASPDGLSHLGDTEWEDLEAGVKYALSQGAKRILLYGWSMGGTIVEIFLSRSSYANHIHAVILDSPILNWRVTIKHLAKKNSLPSFFAKITESMVSMRTGIKFDTLHSQKQSRLPILLFHGVADTTAPIAVSDAFVSEHADIRYHRIEDAEHTQCWNANHEKYEIELRSFLIRVQEEVWI